MVCGLRWAVGRVKSRSAGGHRQGWQKTLAVGESHSFWLLFGRELFCWRAEILSGCELAVGAAAAEAASAIVAAAVAAGGAAPGVVVWGEAAAGVPGRGGAEEFEEAVEDEEDDKEAGDEEEGEALADVVGFCLLGWWWELGVVLVEVLSEGLVVFGGDLGGEIGVGFGESGGGVGGGGVVGGEGWECDFVEDASALGVVEAAFESLADLDADFAGLLGTESVGYGEEEAAVVLVALADAPGGGEVEGEVLDGDVASGGDGDEDEFGGGELFEESSVLFDEGAIGGGEELSPVEDEASVSWFGWDVAVVGCGDAWVWDGGVASWGGWLWVIAGGSLGLLVGQCVGDGGGEEAFFLGGGGVCRL